MTVLITIIVVGIVAAIIYLNRSSGKMPRSRGEFLSELAKFVEGQLQPIEGQQDGFVINFSFDQFNFSYEDIQMAGFREKVNKAYLKLQTHCFLTMNFYERKQSSGSFNFSTTNTLNKPAPGSSSPNARLNVPDKFKAFEILTDDIEFANRLFSNQRFVNILHQYVNADQRGYYFMALSMNKGVITLEFYNERRFTPNLESIRTNIHLFEDNIKDLISLSKIIQSSS